MKDINIYIIEKLTINKDTAIEKIEDILSDEELNYKFSKLSVHSSDKSTVKELIEKSEKFYQKSPVETAKKLKSEIKTDKFIRDKSFSRDVKRCIKLGKSSNEGYYITTDVNYKGYCLVFDPNGSVTTHNYSFLITRAASKVGKTLTPVEYVEPEEDSKEIHDIMDSCYPEYKDVPRKYFDDIEDAWKYIEQKYGRF